MEREKSGALVVLVVALGMLVGQSSGASFRDCYFQCFILCVIEPSNSAYACSFECLKDCLLPTKFPCLKLDNCTNNIPKSPQSLHLNNTHDFCKLGCASSLCTHISTKQNPDGEKVESCVGSCSQWCTKNYVSP